jgi:hypothetical protein
MAWNDTLITYAKGTYHKVRSCLIHRVYVQAKGQQGVKFPEGFHSGKLIYL